MTDFHGLAEKGKPRPKSIKAVVYRSPLAVGGIRCPTCRTQTHQVTASRHIEGTLNRRRICENDHRFTTVEVALEADAISAKLAARIGRLCVSQHSIILALLAEFEKEPEEGR